MGQIYTFYPASDNVQYQRNIGLLKFMQHLSETFKESTEFGISCAILFDPALPKLRFGILTCVIHVVCLNYKKM